MSHNYDNLDEALNTENSIVETTAKEIEVSKPKGNDIEKDYEYTRANLYSLIEKGK